MKKILLSIFLFTFVYGDLIPPNTKSIKKTVILTNAPDFRSVAIFLCHRFIGNGELECSVLDSYNTEISKGYKFNRGPYLFAIKKSTIAKFGGMNKFLQKPLKEALDYLIKKRHLHSTIGGSSIRYVDINSKAQDTIKRYKILSIKGNKLDLIEVK